MTGDDDGYGRVTSGFYDGAYARLRDSSGDAAWYRSLAREARGPVLELGAGTGRVLLPIARELEPQGVACVGVDRSPEMLNALRAKGLPANLRLAEGSMQDFDLAPERFALIFSAFRAFQHLDRVEDQLGCLARVRDHLAPGGAFAFDVFHPRLDRIAILEEPESEDARWVQGGDEIVRFASARRDPVNQRVHVRMRYERWRADVRVADEGVAFDMRYFFRFELEHLLARAGFADLSLYGDFQGAPFAAGASDFVVVARVA